MFERVWLDANLDPLFNVVSMFLLLCIKFDRNSNVYLNILVINKTLKNYKSFLDGDYSFSFLALFFKIDRSRDIWKFDSRSLNSE